MTASTLTRRSRSDFCGDLESGDRYCQLDWYAEDAELRIVDKGQRLARSLRGTAAIGDWIDRTWADKRAARVVYHAEHENEMTVIAELQQEDGTFCIYSSVARLRRGLIVDQQVVLL